MINEAAAKKYFPTRTRSASASDPARDDRSARDRRGPAATPNTTALRESGAAHDVRAVLPDPDRSAVIEVRTAAIRSPYQRGARAPQIERTADEDVSTSSNRSSGGSPRRDIRQGTRCSADSRCWWPQRAVGCMSYAVSRRTNEIGIAWRSAPSAAP